MLDNKKYSQLLPNLPLDSKSGDSGLLCENIAADLLKDGLGWWIGIELLGVILVVDIVSDTNELATIVCAGEENNGNTKDFGIWDTAGIGWIGLKDELVYADGNGANEEGVEFLVMLVADIVSQFFVLYPVRGGWNAYEVADPT